ncbi:MGH1-like glycoside hydrolase domain-containing protein [Chryseobacterium gambrini]|uniref:Glycosyl hydrolase family 63 C-terminal domain-containing protein n=1 Tax=Chryseobacterium gambrini TaxID=373672 RepID=A0A1N7NTB8_9FLAO|nr:glucosidase [Chryseobacterium gambrini]SIT01613.1 Glycosyl hydrolase family 63 C-terminal domain-containing protein [Chryseobacterium gambrini]
MKEKERLSNVTWKKWGPYVSNREWGLVREDYSANGDAWNYTNHDIAEAKTYRWGEEGICGICDDLQKLVFSVGFWNKKDKMVKERFFGLSNGQGNHGEDVKEYFYYLDSTPTHSYMKMLYKYPQNAFPYDDLIKTNAERGKEDPEYELIDTGIFDQNEYFDIFIEYAKESQNDILVKLTVVNKSEQEAPLIILPTVWFRNTWNWGYNDYKPQMNSENSDCITINHHDLEIKNVYAKNAQKVLFCDNETNNERLYQSQNQSKYTKDGINDFIINGNSQSVNPKDFGTKASFLIDENFKPKETKTFEFRLSDQDLKQPFQDFEEIFVSRQKEADEFYTDIQCGIKTEDEKLVQRQAFAGMLWNKMFYHYNVERWLKGDPSQVPPPKSREHIRNSEWKHLNNEHIISMPDKWEYPWYATWDLAFHTISFSLIDPDFAKHQLKLFLFEWYMHPNGQLPAYEWDFSDVNPPVHAWAVFRVFKIDEYLKGNPDLQFLESAFQKLLMNFTWWVNKKDNNGNNIFEGGFLGLDNIGVFDRNMPLPNGEHLEQSDGTSWMAMFALNMMRIALELALYNNVYEEMAMKFFEHFLAIANSLDNMGEECFSLWDEEDEFFYDAIASSDGDHMYLKLRTIVGLIPMFAVEVIDDEMIEKLPNFKKRMKWVLENKPELAALVSHWEVKGDESKHLLSLLRGHRLKRLLSRMLDPDQFLSEFGVRALSKEYEKNPFTLNLNGTDYKVKYTPAESDSGLFGGNSNWRGPIWFPINFLIIESLQRFFFYYSPDFLVEYPTGSGNYSNLDEIAEALSRRLSSLFLKDEYGNRPFNSQYPRFQNDLDFKDYILFYEYFHGDTGRGVGASHQTGWTGLIAKILMPRFSRKNIAESETETPKNVEF